MLELIFQGFVEWGYGLTLECWEYFSTSLLDIMSMDFTYLRTHIPVIDTIMQIMLAVGWALLMGNLVFQALKSMATGLGFEAEDPKLLFTRTFVFAFLLLASPQICEIGLNMTQTIINILEIPDAVTITFADEATFGGLAAAWLLVVICGIVVMFKVFKLILEIAERYIILAMLAICAPLAFGMGGSRSTSDIFTGWCRMFASMCFVMVSNIIFFKMLLSVLSYVPSGLDVLPWMVLVFGIVKVAKKIDAIITRIGLNPAITGDGLGRGLPGMLTYAVLRTVTQNMVKSVGKSAGGGAHDAASKPPSGGGPNGPRSGAPSGGVHFTDAGAGAGQQASAQADGRSQSASAQGGATTQGGGQQSSAQQQTTTGTTVGGSVQQEQHSTAYQQNASRQSAVPPGTRRAASHIRGTAGTAKPAAGQSDRATGMRSGMAGTRIQSQSAAEQTSKAGDGHHGMAGTRFTSVQSVRKSGDLRATEQNSVSSGTVVQGSPAAPASAGKPQGPGAAGQAREKADGTRYTSRAAEKAPAPESARVGSAAPPAPTSPIARTEAAAAHPQPGESARHGRNSAPAGQPPSAAAARQTSGTARQEPQRPPTGTTVPPKAPVSATHSGMAGTAPPREPSAQASQTSQKQTMRTSTTPAKPGPSSRGGKATSSATAQQEKGRSKSRQSTRGKNGGAANGK